jgi:hypothetical protein
MEKNDSSPYTERFGGNSGVKQMPTDTIEASEIVELFVGIAFLNYCVNDLICILIRIKKNLYLTQNI